MRFSLITFSSAALIGLLTHSALAAPVSSLVLTPGGYHASNKVHPVPTGGRVSHVGSDIHVLDTSDNLVYIATPTTTVATPEQTGSVTDAHWLNTGSIPIYFFLNTWNVPPVPATWHGQTIFLFNAIALSTFEASLQTVLQYGGSAAGGGEYWAVATWYLYGSEAFYTTPVEVTPGQSLATSIELIEVNGTVYDYLAAFDVAGTELGVNGGEQLTLTTKTLESYGVTEASDYPTGETEFSINILLYNNDFAPVSWSVVDDPADGLSTTVNTNSGDGGVITITY
ncbi:hypothetical protein C8F04DRAFT_1265205 [Mycena alexandri]|uniref:Uncharacterized protein n=1 Tax=Mycena alexandri TaxID=1745969 RepID=A0AAD6X1U0_9AGAR|nr:hypothetical protein C8F04DRAFT_1265205 [Mycena alexandri]